MSLPQANKEKAVRERAKQEELGLDLPVDGLTIEQKARLFREVNEGITYGRFAALTDSFVFGAIKSAKDRLKSTDEEVDLLRGIAHLGNEYRKHKMNSDLEALKMLCRDWNAKFGAKR